MRVYINGYSLQAEQETADEASVVRWVGQNPQTYWEAHHNRRLMANGVLNTDDRSWTFSLATAEGEQWRADVYTILNRVCAKLPKQELGKEEDIPQWSGVNDDIARLRSAVADASTSLNSSRRRIHAMTLDCTNLVSSLRQYKRDLFELENKPKGEGKRFLDYTGLEGYKFEVRKIGASSYHIRWDMPDGVSFTDQLIRVKTRAMQVKLVVNTTGRLVRLSIGHRDSVGTGYQFNSLGHPHMSSEGNCCIMTESKNQINKFLQERDLFGLVTFVEAYAGTYDAAGGPYTRLDQWARNNGLAVEKLVEGGPEEEESPAMVETGPDTVTPTPTLTFPCRGCNQEVPESIWNAGWGGRCLNCANALAEENGEERYTCLECGEEFWESDYRWQDGDNGVCLACVEHN